MPDNGEYQPTDRDMAYVQKAITLLEIPEGKIDAIDIEAFSKGKTLDDPSTASLQRLNTWVLDCAYTYSLQKNEVDEDILARFQEDFEKWTSEHFGRVNSNFRRALRKVLTEKGIYLGKPNARINQRLEALVNEEDLPEWDEGELEKQEDLHPRTLAHRHRRELLRSDRPRTRPTNDEQRQGENKRQPAEGDKRQPDEGDGRIQSDRRIPPKTKYRPLQPDGERQRPQRQHDGNDNAYRPRSKGYMQSESSHNRQPSPVDNKRESNQPSYRVAILPPQPSTPTPPIPPIPPSPPILEPPSPSLNYPGKPCFSDDQGASNDGDDLNYSAFMVADESFRYRLTASQLAQSQYSVESEDTAQSVRDESALVESGQKSTSALVESGSTMFTLDRYPESGMIQFHAGVFQVTIDTVNGPATLRSNVVKPYNHHHEATETPPIHNELPHPIKYPVPEQPRRRGRPRKTPAVVHMTHRYGAQTAKCMQSCLASLEKDIRRVQSSTSSNLSTDWRNRELTGSKHTRGTTVANSRWTVRPPAHAY
jgi:hypothetical protein